MDLFFERYNLPKPTQEETDHLNSPMSIKEIKFVAKSHPKKRERERKKKKKKEKENAPDQFVWVLGPRHANDTASALLLYVC